MRFCRYPWADRSPSMDRARSPACPKTDTKTLAWRRSGEVSTAVTVTKPTRGSLISVAIASESTSRTASSTRSMRSDFMLVPKVRPRDHTALDADALRTAGVEQAARGVGRLLAPPGRPRGHRDRERRALPGVLVVHLRHGGAELRAQRRLERVQLGSLGLQRPGD